MVMVHFENFACQWTIICFLSLFNEHMFVRGRDYSSSTDRQSLRHRYSRTWSDWTPWSTCSRKCGGGVRQRTRVCKVRIVESRVSPDTCVGETIEYELCSRHACSSLAEDFLDYQCSQRNGQIILGRKIEEWIPYRYGRNPCELQCWPKDRSLVYSFGKVIDGTQCPAFDPKDSALCVNGRCMPVDCAGHLGSDNRRDKCGVCKGDNSTCVKYQNTFWRRRRNKLHGDRGKGDHHYDYNEIFRIPAGATHIVVTENSDTNFLTLVDHKGNYLINGNRRVQSPGRFPVHGSEFMYNRTREGYERLSSEGPTKFTLIVLVLGSGDIPTVHYEYWVSSANSMSESHIQHSPYSIKTSESVSKQPHNSQAFYPLDNTIETSSVQTKLLPVTKFQGYKSYYHRNEILKSVPSWSIKRHKSYKQPINRSFANTQTDLNSIKWHNGTNDHLRHLESVSRNTSERRPVIHRIPKNYQTTISPLTSTRRENYKTVTDRFSDFGRPNGTSAFTRYNHVVTDYGAKGARVKTSERSRKIKVEGNNERKKESKKRQSKIEKVEDSRSQRKRKSDNGDCLPCSRTKQQTRNFCKSDFVLQATVLAFEKHHQNIRFELEVTRSYKNKVPILSREYVWTPDICQCPKLRVGKEYILMGHSSTTLNRRESKLIVDRNSFVRQYSQKRARTMLKLVRDQNSVCRKF